MLGVPALCGRRKGDQMAYAIGTRAIWTSPKGYSKPREVVRIVATRGSMVQIQSAPDEHEGSEPFYYWINASELSPL